MSLFVEIRENLELFKFCFKYKIKQRKEERKEERKKCLKFKNTF